MKLKNFLKKIKCKIYGHDLSIIDISMTGSTEKIYCKRCKNFYGINHDIRAFISWGNCLEKCFTIINGRHSKHWPKERQWLKQGTE